jgi:FkbM family methyltransferase
MKSPNFFFSLVSFFSRLIPLSVKQAIYRSPLLSRWVRGSLNRNAPEGLTPIKIAGGSIAGLEIVLNLQKEKAYWLGTYEVELQTAVADLIKPGMIAFDVGANIGYVTLMLAKAVGESGKVFAFEALPANFDRLRDNVQINDMANRVFLSPYAVVDSARKLEFWLGPSGAMGKAEGSAGRKDIAYTQSLSVEGISLDSFVYDRNNPLPDVVKMDIEGGEVMALPGMLRILEEAHPIMLLELHGPEAARAAWDILHGLGYRICRMAPSYPVVPSLEALDWKAYLIGLKP